MFMPNNRRISKTFGNWLFRELGREKITQAELSRRSGLTTGAVSNYVNGLIPGEYEVIKKLVEALECPPEETLSAMELLPPQLATDAWSMQFLREMIDMELTEGERDFLATWFKGWKKLRGGITNGLQRKKKAGEEPAETRQS